MTRWRPSADTPEKQAPAQTRRLAHGRWQTHFSTPNTVKSSRLTTDKTPSTIPYGKICTPDIPVDREPNRRAKRQARCGIIFFRDPDMQAWIRDSEMGFSPIKNLASRGCRALQIDAFRCLPAQADSHGSPLP